MSLTGNELVVNGPEYYIKYPDGTEVWLGKLLHRDKKYSHYYGALPPYNNVFIFENMPNEIYVKQTMYHRLPIFYEVDPICCCANNETNIDSVKQTYTQK